ARGRELRVQHVPVHEEEHAREALPRAARLAAAGRRARGRAGSCTKTDPADVGSVGMKLAVAVVVCALAGVARADSPIPADAQQLVTVVIGDGSSTTATLRLYKGDGDRWVQVGKPWPAAIGAGAAWGAGLHGAGAPAGRRGAVKKEGDGKSPAGAFGVR